MDKLNRLVTLFIDFSELRALNHQIMTMQDWVIHVNKFRIKQDKLYISNFDKEFEKYLKGENR
jgi:hypothetical protein